MDRVKFRLGPGAILAAAGMFFVGGTAALSALAAAVLVHELGHMAAAQVCGAELAAVRITAAGPVLVFAGITPGKKSLLVAAAGPVAGLLFALGCALTGREFALYTAAVSLLTAAFNLMPALPLDGGRIAEELLADVVQPETAGVILRVSGCLCAGAVFCLGLSLHLAVVCGMGIWLAVLVNFPALR